MKLKFWTVLILYTISLGVFCSYANATAYSVVIDTDGAIDDMRSITMFLAAKDIHVLAITCSQGTLKPGDIYPKVKSLLADLNHEDIPVGIDEGLEKELPVWAPFARKISWGDPVPGSSEEDIVSKAPELINKAFECCPGNITLIALGTLKTYADWLEKYPQFIPRVEGIIWYNNVKIEDGFNYQVCPECFDAIKQTNIKLDVVSNSSGRFLVDDDYLSSLRSSNSVYARQIIKVHKQPEIVERIEIKHLKLWDDFVPLYLTSPNLFEVQRDVQINYITVDKTLSPSFIYESMLLLLKSKD